MLASISVIEALTKFATGLAYGFSLAIPPGPMNAIIASRSIISPKHGFSVGAGAMTADFLLMMATLAFYRIIHRLPMFPFYVAGSLLMLYLIRDIAKMKTYLREDEVRDVHKVSGSYLLGVTMGLVNPYQIGWWITAGLSFISIFGLLAVTGLFTAIAIWITVFPLTVKAGYNVNSRATILIIKVFSITVLASFATIFLYKAVLEVI